MVALQSKCSSPCKPPGRYPSQPQVRCRAVLCCAVPCCVVLCCVVPCRAMSCRAVPCRAVPCRAVLCRAMPCRAVLCCAVPCCVVLCCAVLLGSEPHNLQAWDFQCGSPTFFSFRLRCALNVDIRPQTSSFSDCECRLLPLWRFQRRQAAQKWSPVRIITSRFVLNRPQLPATTNPANCQSWLIYLKHSLHARFELLHWCQLCSQCYDQVLWV